MSTLHLTVIGAGRMGAAIASVFASSGASVAVVEPSAHVRAGLPAELTRIATLLGERPARVETHDNLATAITEETELVIEAVIERAEVKRDVIGRASQLSSRAVIATNTSSIPLRELLPAVTDTSRFVGAHFWNPPYAVRLVEVVVHPDQDGDARTRLTNALDGAGFVPVVINTDIPGLVGNRLQHALKREAIALVEAGVCDAETIDTIAKLTIGQRLEVLGPLEQSDLVGLDLTLAIHEVLMPELDRATEPKGLLRRLVAEGRLGMKTGGGFRDWTDDEAQRVRERVDRHVLAAGRRTRTSGLEEDRA